MKRLTKPRNKRGTSKGDRLNWTPLRDVKPVSLKAVLNKGHWLTAADLNKMAGGSNTPLNLLIP